MEGQAVVGNQIQQPPVNPASISKKPNRWIIAGIILVLLLVFGSIYAFSIPSRKPILPPPKPLASPPPPISPAQDAIANWKTVRLVGLSFNIPSSWSSREGEDSLTQRAWINLYPPEISTDQGDINERDADVAFVVHYLPNTTVSTELERIISARVIQNITEEIAIASAPNMGKGVVTGKSIYGTYVGSGPYRPKDAKFTYFQYDKDVYSFEFTDVTKTFGKYYDQILSTFKFTDQKDQVVCTLEAKLCPDGSYVSRQPPNCEFAACP